MRAMLAFMKKEWMEQVRSGRLLILAVLFVLLGIMNPAIAKLTPWLLEMMADSLAESGMTVSAVTVDALTSWTQFFKNVPMGLIAFVLIESSIFTREYQSGTLVLALTKGLKRYKVVAAKTVILLILWSGCYWLCFGITYGYNAYFWDNAAASELLAAVSGWWLLGVWTIILLVLFSTVGKSNSVVLCGTGGTFLAAYLVGLLPKVKGYVPTVLMNGTAVIYGAESGKTYAAAAVVTAGLSLICLTGSVWMLNRKKM